MSVDTMLRNAMKEHKAGHFNAAGKLYQKILSYDPNDADVFNLLGVLSLQCGDLFKASYLIRKAIQIRPAIAQYHFNLGCALNRIGDKHAAIESYRESLKLEPGFKIAEESLISLGEVDIVKPAAIMNSASMKRHEVVQAVIDRIQGKTYLEIGIDTGESFLKIGAPKKYGVDPVPTDDLIKTLLTNVAITHLKYAPAGSEQSLLVELNAISEDTPTIVMKNQICEFYYVTSDEFFARHAPLIFEQESIDVAFVDGLHTYHQAYQDVCNAIDFLATGGVILMHDCNPPSESSAYPAASWEAAARMNLPGWNGNWCGDVWKSIVRLRAAHKDLRVFVLDCDFGIGVVSRGEAENMLDMTMPEIEYLSFKDLHRERKNLLNLKPQSFLFEFLQTL